MKAYKGMLAGTLCLAAINQIFSLLDPQIFRLIIDRYISKFQEYDVHSFAKGVGGLLLLSITVAMVSRIAKNFQDYFANVMTQNIGMNIYQHTIRHAFSLPYRVFEDQQSGQLLDKLNKARQSIQTFIISLINNVFVALVGLIFVFFYSMTVHRSITLFFGALFPLMGIIIYTLSRRLKKAQQAIVVETANLAGATTETIRNVSLVKSLGLEDQEMNRLEEVNKQILGLELKKIKTVRLIDFTQGTLINFVRVALLGTLFWLVYKQEVTLGQFFSLYFYSFYIFNPLYMLGEVVKNYQEAKASDEVIREVLAQLPATDTTQSTETLSQINNITFDQVGFTYTGERDVLENVSLHIDHGKTIAFVGPSGSGKSTIIKLLLGLYTPTEGQVLINGKDLSVYDPQERKALIGLVSQDTQLFSGTIKQNLQFVRPEATDEQMLAVLVSAQLHDIVKEIADLDIKIGEGGLKLSGGQKQRLAIARALLREPQLLIFDEATSSLDSLIEAEITETIKTISSIPSNELITILIAHRLSTVVHADVIYVLEKGKIKESGSHEKLLAQEGLYAMLRKQQIGEETYGYRA